MNDYPEEADVELRRSNARFLAELQRLRSEWADDVVAERDEPPRHPTRARFRANADYEKACERYYYLYLAWQRRVLKEGLPVERPKAPLSIVSLFGR